LEEARIIALVRNGDVDAFTEVVEQYQAPIQRYIYRLTGDYIMAQDLTQDTFLQAYRSILKTGSDISLKAWLYKIATNNALQHHRRKRLLSFISLSKYSPSDMSTVEDHTGRVSDEKIMIREALLKIPGEQRTCLILHIVEGFKYREIADILETSEDAIRKRVARGKETFQKLYREGEEL
jgi:RNA polymerase sigma factor (sigma-70 family)